MQPIETFVGSCPSVMILEVSQQGYLFGSGDDFSNAQAIAAVFAAANGTGLEVANDPPREPPPATVPKQMSISEAAKLRTFEHHTGMKVVLGEASNSSAASPEYAPEPAPEGNDDSVTLLAGEFIHESSLG